MRSWKIRAASVAAGVLLMVGIGHAQRGGGDWLTNGFDVQRSSWVRGDGKINPKSMGAFKLHFKLKSTNTARQGNNLTSPALMDFFITHVGFRTLGFFGGSGDYALGIDTDMGKKEWDRKFSPSAVPAGPSAACPGGMTSSVTRPAQLGYAAVIIGGGGGGRGQAAKSAVGAPLEGAAGLRELAGRRTFTGPPKPPTAPAKRVATAPSPFEPRTQWVHALTSDGKLHSVYASNGEEPFPAVDFLPKGAHARGLVVTSRIAYVATVNNCGGVPDGIWSLEIDAKKVSSWKAPATIAGAAGFAMGPEGQIFVAAGNELIVLDASLKQTASWKAPAAFNSSPTVFDNKGTDMIAITTADGNLHIFDGEKLAAPVASVAAKVTGYAVGAVASWQDAAGGRWILVPGSAGVEAFLFGADGLKSGWKSRELANAGVPLIINGVVFALQKGAQGKNAVVYALDGLNGQELWNSGATITSHVTSGGMAAGGGRVYVSGVDGTQYSFGFHLEI